VTVRDGHAVNVQGARQYREGESFEADDREAALWLEQQVVMPAKVPTIRATTKATTRASKKT